MKWIQKKLVVATLASCLVTQVTYANEALKKAQKYLNDNDLSAAVIELKNAVQSEPKNAEARLLLAETYVKLNNWNAAEKELSKAERLKADRLRWIRAMTKTLTAQGKFEEIPDFIQIKESDSRAIQAEVKAVLGMMDGYRKDMAKAEEAFKKALSLDPNNIQAKIGLANLGLRTGNYQQGLQQIEKVLKQEPGHNEALLLKAQLNLFDGKFDTAMSTLQSAIDGDPRFVQARFLRTNLNLSKKNFDAAKVDIDYLQQLIPEHFLVDILKGKQLLVQKEFKDSKSFLQAAQSKINQPHHELEKLLALIDIHEKNWQQAELHLSNSYRLNPDDNNVGLLLANLYMSQLNAPKKASEIYQELLKAKPDDPDLVVRLADSYQRAGNETKATELLQESISSAADVDTKEKYKTMLAQTKITAGEIGDAIDILEQSPKSKEFSIQSIYLGLSYAQSGEYKKAEKYVKNLISQNPENAMARNLLGAVYLDQKQFDKALAAFKKAVELKPDYKSAQLNIARIYITKKQYKEAIEHFKKIDKITKGDAQIAYGMFESYLGLKNEPEAFKWLDEALKRDPMYDAAIVANINRNMRQGKKAEAVALANEFIAGEPQNAEAHFQLGRIYMRNRDNSDLSKAIDSLRKAVNLSPKGFNYSRALSAALLRDNNLADAINVMEKFSVKSPDNVFASTSLVKLYIDDKKYFKAQRIAKDLKSNPQYEALGHELLADILMAQQKFADALKDYKAAYKLKPVSGLIQKMHRLHVLNAEPNKAESVLLGWIKNNEKDTHIRMILADWYQREAKKDAAIKQYEQVIKYSENNILALNNLAWLYMEKKNSRALSLAERIEQLAPQRADILDTAGWIYVQFEKPKRGLNLLERAVEINKGLREARYHKAVAYYKLGEKDKARELIEDLVNSGQPFLGQEEAKRLLKQL